MPYVLQTDLEMDLLGQIGVCNEDLVNVGEHQTTHLSHIGQLAGALRLGETQKNYDCDKKHTQK